MTNPAEIFENLYDGLRDGTIVDPDYFQRPCGLWDHIDFLDEPCDCEDCTTEEVAV